MNFKEYWVDKSNHYDYPMPAAKDAWQEQQAIIDDFNTHHLNYVNGVLEAEAKYLDEIDSLKAQLNNMEQCYIGIKKERDNLQERVTSTLGVCTENRLCIGKFMIEDETLELISDIEKALRGES